MSQLADSRKLHCNDCLGLRRHTLLFRTTREDVDDEGEDTEYREVTAYALARCDGCGSVTLHTTWSDSIGSEPIEMQWPPRVARSHPKWLADLFLSDSIDNPFKSGFVMEIYSCLKSGNLRLAVLGVRALLEQVMLEHINDQRSFAANLTEFERQGYISRVQRLAIAPVVEAGHASMHRGFKPSAADVDAILDVTENVLESIYVAKI